MVSLEEKISTPSELPWNTNMAAVSSILEHKNGRSDVMWNSSIILKPCYMQYATEGDFENGSPDNMGSVGNLVTYILTLPQV